MCVAGLSVGGVYINNKLITEEQNAEQLAKARLFADHFYIPFEAVDLHTYQWNLLKR